jgi:hypothetical protein
MSLTRFEKLALATAQTARRALAERTADGRLRAIDVIENLEAVLTVANSPLLQANGEVLPKVPEHDPLKTENGERFGKSAYLLGDPDRPTTWKARVEETPGHVTVAQLGRAYAALTKGFRGNKVDAPEDAKAEALRRLRGLYRTHGARWPADA